MREEKKITPHFLRDILNPDIFLCICEEKYKKEMKKGSKKVRTKFFHPEKYKKKNRVDFTRLISDLKKEITASLRDTRSQILLFNDILSAMKIIPAEESLSHYESQLDTLCSEQDIMCICTYDFTIHSSLLFTALRTHSAVYNRGRLCKNVYYIPDDQSADSAVSVEPYFENLISITKTEERLKKMEEKVEFHQKKSDKKYWDLIEHVPDAIYSLNDKGEFIEINTASTLMLGYPREDLLGKHFSALIHPEDIKKATQSFKELVKGKREKTMGLELRLLTNTGSIRIGELNARAIYDEKGRFIKTQGIVRDITERKKQEKDLEFMAGVVETVSEAVVITDMDGIITYVNPAAYTMFGYSKRELEGEQASLLYANSHRSVLSTILSHIQTGEWEGEIGGITKNGDRFPAWVRASALHDRNEDVINAIMVFRDITEQKKAEEKLERYALLLEMKVKKKTQGTETLLKTSYALRNTSNWKEGTAIIIEGIVGGLGFEGAAIFFKQRGTNTLECRCQHNFPSHLCDHTISLSEDEHGAVKCVNQKIPLVIEESTHTDLTQPLIKENEEVVWVPILFHSEVLGILAAYGKKENSHIEPEDVDMVQLYANLIAEFIERTRMVVKPIAENQVSTPSKYYLELQETYLLEEEKPIKAFDMFTDLVKHGFRGFGICRTHPQKIREQYSLEKTPLMWLSEIDTSQEEQVSPKDIPKLIYLVSEFIKRAQPAVVLLEGIEYLVVQNDFNMILRLLHTLSDYVATSNSVLLLPINPKTLPSHQYFMLRTAFNTLD
jgi:PAS domain S-box-containing protein